MSERYSISGQILTDMADAIRNHKGLVSTTFTGTYLGHSSQAKSQAFSLPTSLLKGKTYKMTFTATYARNSADSYYRVTPTIRENNADGAVIYKDLVKQDSETVITFTTAAEVSAIYVSVSSANFVTLGAVKIEPCDKDGNILYYFTPAQMVEVMENALPTANDLVLSGAQQYAFQWDKNKWMIEKFGDIITTNKIHTCNNMFEYYTGSKIPFDLNFDTSKTGTVETSIVNMFANSHIEEAPRMNNFKPGRTAYVFSNCSYLKDFPEDYFDTWDWSLIDNATSGVTFTAASPIASCYSLRKFPMTFLEHINPKATGSSYTPFYYMASNCRCLDEIVNIPAPANAGLAISSNVFTSTIDGCSRLKDFTFASGITLNWSKQVINFSNGVGYCGAYAQNYVTGYNSGITKDKEVKDDATYQLLKNDPDWFTADKAYSRYDHDSAVRTINSLPTMTGTGNVLQFTGAAGEKTDGGAINTLTEAEIARAAAKGWTVTLV